MNRLHNFGFLAVSLCFIGAFAIGCVSVSISPKGPDRSREAKYKSPAAPFEEIGTTPADHAWQNAGNGNTISYLSSCNDPAEPSLESAAAEMVADLRDLKTLRSEFIRFNGREALDQEVEGRIEGVTTRVHTLIFRKNACLYTLSYVGVAKAFPVNTGDFQNFVKGFEVP